MAAPLSRRLPLAALLAVTLATPLAAQERAVSEEPVLLLADEVVYDRDLGVVTASGHVELSQTGRILIADTVNYNLRQDLITASGNVSLLEPTGEVMFADYFELTGNLKDGFARDVRMLLADQARMAAVAGQRSGGDRTELDKAVYSPCRPCQDDPGRPLLWQVKALRVVHDQTSKDVEYEDAWLEMYGVPVAYTPYFSHPDPTVKRRSGFLPFTAGSSSTLGGIFQVPYFYALSPQEDLTLTPMLTTNEGLVLAAEHRRLFRNGRTDTEISLTRDSRQDVLGHIEATGRFDLSDSWRAGYQVERSSTDTYLRRYRFNTDDNRPWLTTRPYAERFSADSYLLTEAFAFQGLRLRDDPGQSPIVLPAVQYSYVGDRDWYGGSWSLDTSALALTRGEGTDTRRLSVEGGWHRPLLTSGGHMYTVGFSLRGDGYYVSDRLPTSAGAETTGRLVPQASLEWRYPFARVHESSQEIIEPVVLAVLSPYGGNPDDIPNEDSLDLTFDDTSLFSPNRFHGLDRVESGPRVSYGLQYGIFANNGMHASAMAGQVFRLREDTAFPVDSGLRDTVSDYVGRVSVSWRDDLDLYYRFRIDKETLAQRRSELVATAGPKALRVRAGYIFTNRISPTAEFGDREELYLSASSAMTRRWSTTVFTRYDIRAAEPLQSGVALIYDDECFTAVASLSNDQTSDRDYEGGTSVLLRLVFKTLGEVPFSLF